MLIFIATLQLAVLIFLVIVTICQFDIIKKACAELDKQGKELSDMIQDAELQDAMREERQAANEMIN